MDFKNFGVSELGTLLGILMLGVLIWFGKVDGVTGTGGITILVGTLTTMRKINAGQAIKFGAGQTSIETQGGPPPPPAPPAV